MTDTSPIVEGLFRIHKIISRGLSVSIRKCDEYIVNGGIPEGEVAGFSMYLSSLKLVTHAHHLSEDEIAFPYFKDKIEAPYDRLREDHNMMAGILEMFDHNLLQISSDKVGKLRDVLLEFDKLWVPHIKTEEENFTSEKVQPAIGIKDQFVLIEKLAQHGQKNTGPGNTTLPFLIFNLEGKDREDFMMSFPWIVKKILIPVIWKRQWKPMSPFLLSPS